MQAFPYPFPCVFGVRERLELVFNTLPLKTRASLVTQMIKNLPSMQENRVRSLCWEDPLEKGLATHSSILAWKIPQMEEPDWLQSMGSQRVWTRTSNYCSQNKSLCHTQSFTCGGSSHRPGPYSASLTHPFSLFFPSFLLFSACKTVLFELCASSHAEPRDFTGNTP